ncbi:MAG: Stress-responsive transcriptional regulator [Firmicutes bacterium]|nr:Stress-responsive transcriptional regulator [Bacillota bacterium]MDI6705989.1 PspC domain-containing protein [Bacillota bacterium]
MAKRLYRSNDNKVIGGVCGGIAEYFDIDPTLVRLLWVLLTFSVGIGVIAYIVCAIVIPERPSSGIKYKDIESGDEVPASARMYENFDSQDNTQDTAQRGEDKSRTFLGIILIALGGFLLFKRWFFWIDFGKLWPAILILGGIYVIFRGREGK